MNFVIFNTIIYIHICFIHFDFPKSFDETLNFEVNISNQNEIENLKI